MSIIEELVSERLRQDIPSPVKRDSIMEDLPDPARFNRVHIITGMRRSGKTFYLFQLMNGLSENGVSHDSMFYFDFSDDRLPREQPHLLDSVLDEYWRQVPEARDHGAYLFLDEVQDCPGWQGAARRLAENENVTLVLTGSSSKLSSEEIATQFRGRSHIHELLPCSFAEFLRFHEDRLGGSTAGRLLGRTAFSPQERTALESLFDTYLTVGGFPAVQHDSPASRIEMLQGYARDVVARDVAERMQRASIPLATQMALLILRNTSCETSINGIVETLKASGHRIGWEKAEEMATLMQQAHLYFEVHDYARGTAAGTTAPPKAYAVDPGLAYAVSRASQEGIGTRLETAVYLELRRRMAGRRTDVIASYTEPGKKRRKVDFLVGEAFVNEAEPAAPYALIQVAANIDAEKTLRREVEALDAAMEHTGLSEGSIITLRDDSEIHTEHGCITVLPAWRWFLQREETLLRC